MNPNERCANVTALDRKGARPIKSGGDSRLDAAKTPETRPALRSCPLFPLPQFGRNYPMSPTDTDRPGAGDVDELADQIDAIRSDLQNLTSTVGRIANKQLNRAQDKALATASEAEEAIRRNPLQAVAIAVGVGFLFGVLTRR